MEQKCKIPWGKKIFCSIVKPKKEYPDTPLIFRWSYLSLRPNRQNDVTYYRHLRAEPTSGCHRFWDFILKSEMFRATIYILLLDIAMIFYLQIDFQGEGPLAMRSGHKRILGTNL